MIESTSKFAVKDIVYDKGGFAVARGYWEKKPSLSLACRWHDDGIGYPQTYGKPQWMLLPESDIKVEAIATLDPADDKLVITLS
ncbi:MAG: hypothetical protein ABR611_04895 [Chthoniobacterales bacterium]